MANLFCSSYRLSCFMWLFLLLLSGSRAQTRNTEFRCQKNLQKPARIGVVLDSGTQLGKEHKVAMKMAFRRFQLSSSSCVNLELLLHDSHGNFTSPTSSAALDLIINGRVKVVIGSMTMQEMIAISDPKIPIRIPIVSTSAAFVPQLQPLKMPSLIQMANNIIHRMQCIAAILTRFQWRKVTVFHGITNDHPLVDSELLVQLSDSLRSANAEIQHSLTLSSSRSLSDQNILIEQELKELMITQRNGVFIVTQLSLELVVLLFSKAKKMNMVGNGYFWIVSDDIIDLIGSLDSSFLNKMEDVIGFQTYFDNTKTTFKSFETKFQKIYRLEYPEAEESTKASISTVRAYDASHTITQAMEELGEKFSSSQLQQKILASNFAGLSGMVRFKNGILSTLPTFQIMKMVNGSYKQVGFWSPKLGFSEKLMGDNKVAIKRGMGNGAAIRNWPRLINGPENSKIFSSRHAHDQRQLTFAIPGEGACLEFVNVSDYLNQINITGFSIDVFKAVMDNINMSYLSSYHFVPFNGTYASMIAEVGNKTYDGAVGDIGILAERFQHVDFTVAYLDADIVMVVEKNDDTWKRLWAFMDVFTLNMWLLIPTMHLFISSVIWLIEREDNNELNGFGNMLWFSVCIIFYMQREPIKNGLARLVLGPWLFAILVVTASFTASLTSMMTISWSQSSVLDVQALKKMNATVGCNTNSFICTYLNNTLNFENEKIRKFSSLNDYPDAFKNETIKAAFFITPHAKVFLAKFCKRFTKAASFKLSGIGFAFPKGDALAVNVSKSIVQLIERKKMLQLEPQLLASFNCFDKPDGRGLGPKPFLGLFFICGCIALLVLLHISIPQIKTKLLGLQKPMP